MSDSITLTDGASILRVSDNGTDRQAVILEIGPLFARIAALPGLNKGAYVDCEMCLSGREPRHLFGNVVESGAMGATIRWMFVETGDEQWMLAQVESLRGAVAAPVQTRRVIKPSAKALTPVEAPAVSTPAAPAVSTPAQDGPAESSESGRVGTRRVLRATGPKLTAQPAAESAPPAPLVPSTAPAAPTTAPAVSAPALERRSAAEDTGARPGVGPVVLASTDKFEKMPVTPAPPGAKVVGADGRLDVGAAIRNRAKTVSASELASRHEKVRVLNMGTIKALIQEAVEEAAGHLTRSLGEAERDRLLKEAEEGFQERMKAFEAQKLTADARATQLQDQLKRAQELLEQERSRAVKADQFTVSAAGLEALDDQLRRSMDRAISGKGVPADLEEQLRTLIAKLLDSEREKMRAKEQEAQNAAILLLEKKISRLSDSLEETERQRDEARDFAAMVESSGGGAVSGQKYKAGIKGEDPNRKRKMELMKELMDENRKLRSALGIAPVVQSSAPAAVSAPSTPAPIPEPVAAAPVEAVNEEAESSVSESSEPMVNPDDLPWDGSSAPTKKEEPVESGVKRIGAYAHKEPPPLTITGGDESDAVTINPDDEPWQPDPGATPAAGIRTPGK